MARKVFTACTKISHREGSGFQEEILQEIAPYPATSTIQKAKLCCQRDRTVERNFTSIEISYLFPFSADLCKFYCICELKECWHLLYQQPNFEDSAKAIFQL